MAEEDEGIQDKPRKRRPDPVEDEEEDERPRRRRRERDDDVRRRGSGDGGVGYVIPYKNGPALAAYYLGIFGLLLCFIGLGPISGIACVVLGIMGMMRASKNPEAHGRAHAIIGIICGAVQLLLGCGIDVGIILSFLPANRR